MGTRHIRAIGAIVFLVLVLALALSAGAQDCGYPACAHYLPTRTPQVSPLATPSRVISRGVSIYVPIIFREAR